MALAAGTILGQFRVRSPLGAGGMGEVYRAHDTRLDREVAIKVLPGSLTTDPERLRRFEQEARAAAALNHPNILAVHQMATEGGVSYLVSELLEGETLRERLAEGPVPLRKAVDYGVQMAHGLAAAHERAVVHRDLKPENLFVTKDGRVKILDFGLAKLTQPRPDAALEATRTQGTEAGVVLGTVGYMAPEQVRGHAADHRADIFALGTILYETVTGWQPFRKPTAPETLTAILNEEPPPLAQLAPDVPPGLQRVVYRCLEKNPEQRFQSASDLAFALEALSGSSISMTVPAMVTPDRAKRRRVGWVAAAVLLLAGAVLVYAWVRPPAVPPVTSYVQLTHDGKPKQLGATDGSRLYLEFIGSGFSSQAPAELSVSGGESRRLSILPSTGMIPLGSSPDGSELLVADAHGTPPAGPLWGVPIVGGSPRRLGDAEGQDAAWSRDNTMLAYANQSDLFVAKSDGSDSHRLASVSESDFIMNPVWSPDGSSLRFTSMNRNGSAAAIWEISTDEEICIPCCQASTLLKTNAAEVGRLTDATSSSCRRIRSGRCRVRAAGLLRGQGRSS